LQRTFYKNPPDAAPLDVEGVVWIDFAHGSTNGPCSQDTFSSLYSGAVRVVGCLHVACGPYWSGRRTSSCIAVWERDVSHACELGLAAWTVCPHSPRSVQTVLLLRIFMRTRGRVCLLLC
jgi:hypothetical protein